MRDELGLFACDKIASVVLASAECRKAHHDELEIISRTVKSNATFRLLRGRRFQRRESEVHRTLQHRSREHRIRQGRQ